MATSAIDSTGPRSDSTLSAFDSNRAGTYGVIGVLAALRQRDADGVGQMITAGLFETSVYWVAQWMASAQVNGQTSVPMPEIRQGSRMGWGVYQLFDTADARQVFIGVTSNAHWDRFCAALGLDELHADPRYHDNAGRVASRHELAAAIATVIGALDAADVQQRLRTAGVPFAPLNRPDQLADDPHLLESGQLVDMPMSNGVTARLPKLPFRASGFDMTLRSAAPALGAHTREVMAELGYSSDEIDAMAACGAIATGPTGAG